ncbi:hypothetical protein [Mucilaginibacter sp. SG564]|uniref:hypothetical protein n=1 Tax=Mucilaginibacter sp. SG564 TaxID=2587022 RepID=UPI001557524D|nr:hypothetical protein [Mucilaginibacter sp. SG564]NOW99080.1 uncharacterized protein YbaR (Trm112 family) [Mucilaginibacter sp. SG564]
MIVVNRVNKNHLFLQTVQAPDLICPLCANKGKLEMSFYQIQLEAGWERNTRQISGSVYCHQCNQDVPIVRWDSALDTFFITEKETIMVSTSFKTGTKGKVLIWLNIVFFGAVILFLAGLFIYHRVVPRPKTADDRYKNEQVLLTRYTAGPQTGDIVKVYRFDSSSMVMYQITAIDHGTKTIKAEPYTKTVIPDTPPITKEATLALTDFDSSKEAIFSLHDYENRMFNTPNGERVGNISAVFRK